MGVWSFISVIFSLSNLLSSPKMSCSMGARLMFILCFLFKASLGMIIENHPYKSSYWIFSMFLFDGGKVDVDAAEVLDISSGVMDIFDILDIF